MPLVGASVTFRLVNFYQRGLATALKEGLVSLAREIELGLEPPRSYRAFSYFGYLTGIVGTGIWGNAVDRRAEQPSRLLPEAGSIIFCQSIDLSGRKPRGD
jgi:hypothetical protein